MVNNLYNNNDLKFLNPKNDANVSNSENKTKSHINSKNGIVYIEEIFSNIYKDVNKKFREFKMLFDKFSQKTLEKTNTIYPQVPENQKNLPPLEKTLEKTNTIYPQVLKSQENIPAAESSIKKEPKNALKDRMEKNSELYKANRSKYEIDQTFVCSDSDFQLKSSQVKNGLQITENFDLRSFLQGEKGRNPNPDPNEPNNDEILKKSIEFLKKEVGELATANNSELKAAYKKFIGILDRYDDEENVRYALDRKHTPPSTFALRSALLLASQEEGVNLESWMVYTKSGKASGNFWPFLDNWKNWVPEAQAAMAKFSEITFVKVLEMAKEHPELLIIFLKGGFGAGKTRLANQLMGENSGGVVAPDTAKRVVRQSMEQLPHSSAHVQGSQLAFKLFDEMIKKVKGTLVYDSSLSSDSDVKSYLEKCRQANIKPCIYDLARDDRARILSVLKRGVEGDDPRIPPDFIINSAIRDKLNRVKCMEAILNDKTQNEALKPEYHFICGNEKGWDTQEIMVLTSNNIIEGIHEEMTKRLELEGIKFDEKYQLQLTVTEEKLKEDFQVLFERPVKEIMEELSTEEKNILQSTFEKRTLDLTNPENINDAKGFYDALAQNIKDVLSLQAVEDAFASLTEETRETFFTSIKTNPSLSYLDLPLRAALMIHQNLRADPWVSQQGK